jgi:hypothetical protein
MIYTYFWDLRNFQIWETKFLRNLSKLIEIIEFMYGILGGSYIQLIHGLLNDTSKNSKAIIYKNFHFKAFFKRIVEIM